jgi:hypothetical protein
MIRRDDLPEARPAFELLEPRLLLSAAAAQPAVELFSASPPLFAENQGQWADASVHYAYQGDGVAFTDARAVVRLSRPVSDFAAGADPVEAIGVDVTSGKSG